MRDDTKNNREKSPNHKVLEREPTIEQGKEVIRVILTVISVRDRNRNTSE